MSETINREAGDKAKGPRLQRLRCVNLCLDAIEKSDNPKIYAAVEYKDDVFLKDVNKSTDYLEQNKNYDPDTTFTMNSVEIIKTLIGFCDMWVEYGAKSKEVYLAFYCTNKIGKESTTLLLKDLGLTLPDKPMLQLFAEKQFDHKDFLPTATALILSNYKDHYDRHKLEGNLLSLSTFKDADWKEFFQAIDWGFEMSDEEATQKEAIEKIKNCKYYTHQCIGKEEIILSRLMDLLDEKQCSEDLLAKFASNSDFELVFRKVASEGSSVLLSDPIYKIWDSIPPPDDKRSILDKITQVCKGYSEHGLKRLARKTTASRMLQENISDPRSFMALRYRVYDKCEAELEKYLQRTDIDLSTDIGVDLLLTHLQNQLADFVDTISTEFQYSLKNSAVIEGIILELFDSCYLSMETR